MAKRSLRWFVGRSLDAAIWHPSHAILLRDQVVNLARNERAGYSDQDHLVATAQWLARAQDATEDGGVSGRYSMRNGWSSSYPETTGYIIPTFLALADAVDATFQERASRCVEFLKTIQLSDGAFPAGELHENRSRPSVFNTAQILHGLVAWHRCTGDKATGEAATRAAQWLVSRQDADGAWRADIYNGVTTYTAHASCWLAEAGKHFGVEDWIRAAGRHLDWVLSHVDQRTGWIDLAGFGEEDHQKRRAVTHTIAYTIWGILDLSCTLGRVDGLAAARKAADRVARRLELSGWLPGELNSDWKASRKDYACLTGNAQMALIWFRLATMNGDVRLINAAIKALDLIKAAQSMTNADGGIRGGVPGSAPLWGDYIYMGLPNWAAKYFIDALIAKRETLASLNRPRERSWTIPADIARVVQATTRGADPTVRVVMLSSPASHKVAQMTRAWARWGFRPSAVVIEHTPEPSLITRLGQRVRAVGLIETIRHSAAQRLRRSEPTSAGESESTDVVQFCLAEKIPMIGVGRLTDPDAVAAVRKLNPTLLVHAGAGILRRELLATAALGAVNAHMGILPRYRGMNVAEWARFEGNPVGCTVHAVDVGIDTGDIIAVNEVDTTGATTIADMRGLVDEAQIALLGQVVRFVVSNGHLPPRRPQAPEEGRQYFTMHPELKALLASELAHAVPAVTNPVSTAYRSSIPVAPASAV
jgi:folate-dependent phosphoribosylglycinamide formyltransferase PurN